MQYLNRGKYGTGEPLGAAWREARTNSGDGSLDKWDSKVEAQGAAGVMRCWVVVDMLRRRQERRSPGKEAMMALFSAQWVNRVDERNYTGSCGYCAVVFVEAKRAGG